MRAEEKRFLKGLESEDSMQYIFVPFSDMKRWTKKGDIYNDFTSSVEGFRRLDEVRALSFLLFKDFVLGNSYSPAEHTRALHSLQTAIISESIIRRNNGTEDQVKYSVVAAMLHDIATPGLGDAAKSMNHQALDEEDYWQEQLDEQGFDFFKRHNIETAKIDHIIHNEGVLGEVLDIADRIAYVCQDSYSIGPLNGTKFGDVYKDVKIDWESQEVYFKDPKRLADLLINRKNLFSRFYVLPENQGRDMVIAKMLEKIYGANPQVLRKMGDGQVLNSIYDYYKELIGPFFLTQSDFVFFMPLYKVFTTEEEAVVYGEGITENDDTVVLGVHKGTKFNPATDHLTLDENGERKPFREVEPEIAFDLEYFSKAIDKFFLFYTVSGDCESRTLFNLLETLFKTNRI